MAHVCLSLTSLAQSWPRKVILTCGSSTTTAADLHDRVAVLSWVLSNKLYVQPGDRVALMGLNSDVFLWTMLAVLDAGAVACPMNWRWSATELAAALDLVHPKVFMADNDCMDLACKASSHSKARGSCTLLNMCIISMSTAVDSSNCSTAQGRHTAAQCTGIVNSACGSSSSSSSVAGPSATHQLQLLLPANNGPALIVFTSGTTGTSKGVTVSHSSILHQSMAKLVTVGYISSDVYLHMAPLFHIGGLSSAFAVLLAGGAHVFMPLYRPYTALQLITKHQITAMIAVPAMMEDLTKAAAEASAAAAAAAGTQTGLQQQQSMQHIGQQLQLPSLRRVLVGAGGMPLSLQRAVAALCPNADLQTAYGMTEAASSITFISVKEQQQLMVQAAQRAAATPTTSVGVCVGRPGPGIAVKIYTALETQQAETVAATPAGATVSAAKGAPDTAKHRDASSRSTSSSCHPPQQHQQPGVVGEVCTRGPHVMLGYWHAASATQQALRDGWLHTGDLGYMDPEGNLWLVGRLKDMVKSGGENVHAAEVETVLTSHAGVAAAAVFGLEHSRLGEQVAAVVVLKQPWTWMQGELQLLGRQQTQQQQQPEAQLGSAGQKQPHQAPQQAQLYLLSQAALQQHCRVAGLSPYKLPRVIACASALPLNSSGKVVKAALKQQLQQLLPILGKSSDMACSSSASRVDASSSSAAGLSADANAAVGDRQQRVRSRL